MGGTLLLVIRTVKERLRQAVTLEDIKPQKGGAVAILFAMSVTFKEIAGLFDVRRNFNVSELTVREIDAIATFGGHKTR
ncbi:MAG: hypothetical protein ABI693_28605 [Bryobacteraceae bacterium]